MVDFVGWSAEEWDIIRDEVRKGYEATAHVRKTLPIGPAPKDPYFVAVPAISVTSGVLGAGTPTGVVPTRLSCKFKVTSAQLGDLGLVCQLARQAGQRIGGVEGRELAEGVASPAAGVTIADPGAHLAGGTIPQNADVTELVRTGLQTLNAAGHFGPYGLVMGPKMWTAYQKADGSGTSGTKISKLLGDESRVAIFAGTEVKGYLFSMGSLAVDLVTVDELSVGLFDMSGGDVTLQAEERYVLRKMDASAVVELKYTGS